MIVEPRKDAVRLQESLTLPATVVNVAPVPDLLATGGAVTLAARITRYGEKGLNAWVCGR